MNYIKKTTLTLHLFLFIFQLTYPLNQGITNGASGYVGDNTTLFSIAKVLSLKYNIPFYLSPYEHSDVFIFDDYELKLNRNQFSRIIYVSTDQDIINNFYQDNILFVSTLYTSIDNISPSWIKILKNGLQLKNGSYLNSLANPLPQDKKTIAVHIRKGNGGGEHYDGEMSLPQYFDFDRSQVIYLLNYPTYPFEYVECSITKSPLGMAHQM